MKIRNAGLVALLSAGALTLSACGGGDDPAAEPETGDTGAATEEAADFPEGSTMAELAEAGSITIGTKFDQPLFGLIGPGRRAAGLRRRDRQAHRRRSSASAEDDIDWVETISSNREPFIESGQVDIVVATYTINDARKEIVVVRRAVLRGGPVDPDPRRPTRTSRARRTSPARRSAPSPARPRRRTCWRTSPRPRSCRSAAYSDCLDPLRNGQVDAVSTDNVILAGFAADSSGDFEVRGEPFTAEPYGIGLAKDDDEFRDWINDALEESFEDGSWTEAWEATAGAVLPTPEPPTVDRY